MLSAVKQQAVNQPVLTLDLLELHFIITSQTESLSTDTTINNN